jgi:hypothetical protein
LLHTSIINFSINGGSVDPSVDYVSSVNPMTPWSAWLQNEEVREAGFNADASGYVLLNDKYVSLNGSPVLQSQYIQPKDYILQE